MSSKRKINVRMKPAAKSREVSARIPRRSISYQDRMGRVLEWVKAKRTLEGEFGVYHLCERIAIIVGKTYAECGDSATLPDDVALMMIRDLLLALDESIIERNKDRSIDLLLSRTKPSWLWVGPDSHLRSLK